MPGTGSPKEDYLLIIVGPLDHAFFKDWRTLKDEIRKGVKEQPGQTEVEADPTKHQSVGWCTFKDLSEAEKAYGKLECQRSILVHLYITSTVDRNFQLHTCNCSDFHKIFRDVGRDGHSKTTCLPSSGADWAVLHRKSLVNFVPILQLRRRPRDAIGRGVQHSYGQATPQTYGYPYGQPPNQSYGQLPRQNYSQVPSQSYAQVPSQSYGPVPGQSYGPLSGQSYNQAPSYDYSRTSPMTDPEVYPQSGTTSAYPGAYRSSSFSTATPLYAANQSGFLVNMTKGTALTESRGIFIQGISFKAKKENLEDLFKGKKITPVDFRLCRGKEGRFNGCVTARFNTPEEANAAIQKLDGSKHMGRLITVRLDKEKTIVKPEYSEPLIVDGTTPSRNVPL
ncbi:uncharacterized protein EI97DRAFT_458984 [Westerdykella ornata]|uniref:RRM domain-containing protein n=1 Tax=Westerdykella ornata TaxID=318751 RepID=A0A6A6JHF8_WESOR|nr:uncharacterized protein EI97DRAFT_458984 [Westerdykella ornata]KAF2275991.1 hypothetical protein EI97DRAFT_458984 [Westerdykella ornata]